MTEPAGAALPEANAKRIQLARNALRAYLVMVDRLPEKHGRNHLTGSRSFEECTEPDSVGCWAHETAEVYLVGARDHLATLLTVLDGRLAAFGPLTLCRAAYEASARAWWLLEWGLSAERRAARGVLARRKAVRARANLEPDPESFKRARLGDLHRRAQDYGLRADLNDRGNVVGYEGERWPNEVDLAKQFHDDPHPQVVNRTRGEVTYRFLSGSPHAQAWLVLRHAILEDSQAVAGKAHASFQPDVDLILAALQEAVYAHAQAVDIRCRSVGWGPFLALPKYKALASNLERAAFPE